jgi:hypothetical protein
VRKIAPSAEHVRKTKKPPKKGEKRIKDRDRKKGACCESRKEEED